MPKSKTVDPVLSTTITGYDAGRVEAMLVEHLAAQVRKGTLESIEREAEAVAVARVKELSAALIDAKVRDVIENGWSEIHPWGEQTGKKFTVRSYIVDYLKTEIARGYNEPRKTPVHIAVEAAIAGVFSKEFTAEIEAARVRLRTQVDTILQAKFAETIKSALGLR